MIKLYNDITFEISKLITQKYSTSFSLAVGILDLEQRQAVYSIYGFVRLADEIVDTFHGYEQERLLHKFESEYYETYRENIGLNPILHSFQLTVKKYNIPDEHIQAFLQSMKADLYKNDYQTKKEIDGYIYGSADVVGLMCLRVFVNGDNNYYNQLVIPAQRLGSAFQKVNFLRDLKNDTQTLKRKYFPEIKNDIFNDDTKNEIVKDIEKDFSEAFIGLIALPNNSKLAVLIAFYYYKTLLNKIKNTPAKKIINTRIRISNFRKMLLFAKAYFVCKTKIV